MGWITEHHAFPNVTLDSLLPPRRFTFDAAQYVGLHPWPSVSIRVKEPVGQGLRLTRARPSAIQSSGGFAAKATKRRFGGFCKSLAATCVEFGRRTQDPIGRGAPDRTLEMGNGAWKHWVLAFTLAGDTQEVGEFENGCQGC
jgi:hypothetical protein